MRKGILLESAKKAGKTAVFLSAGLSSALAGYYSVQTFSQKIQNALEPVTIEKSQLQLPKIEVPSPVLDVKFKSAAAERVSQPKNKPAVVIRKHSLKSLSRLPVAKKTPTKAQVRKKASFKTEKSLDQIQTSQGSALPKVDQHAKMRMAYALMRGRFVAAVKEIPTESNTNTRLAQFVPVPKLSAQESPTTQKIEPLTADDEEKFLTALKSIQGVVTPTNQTKLKEQRFVSQLETKPLSTQNQVSVAQLDTQPTDSINDVSVVPGGIEAYNEAKTQWNLKQAATKPLDERVEIVSNLVTKQMNREKQSNAPPKVVVKPSPSNERAQGDSQLKFDGAPVTAAFFEAFQTENDEEVSDIETDTLSYEGVADSSTHKWVLAKGESYVDTLAWVSNHNDGSAEVLTKNSAWLLSRIAGTQVQEDMGIVFGKVPAGWQVEFSARAEAPVMVNSENEPVQVSDVSQDRYFAYMNTAPGSHLIAAREASSSRSGTVGIPVVAGTATYVDFGESQEIRLLGKVTAASDTVEVAQNRIEVVGQPSKTTFTDSQGYFSVEQVLAFGTYPIYLESELTGHYRHRYRVPPQHGETHFLTRYDDQQVGVWLDQLSGGVSSRSGLVVGSVASVVADQPSRNYYPAVYSLDKEPTLEAETYSLATDERLEVNQPISVETQQFLSVQIPEGFAVAELHNEQNEVVWSELFVASPGVVNVVGN